MWPDDYCEPMIYDCFLRGAEQYFINTQSTPSWEDVQYTIDYHDWLINGGGYYDSNGDPQEYQTTPDDSTNA